MNLILLNLQSNQQIKLEYNNPFVIGRGNVEGCFDKRVSRNHGRISCTLDGKILLVALHCNPCFFTRSGLPPVIQLNKDEEATLNEGDYIGLLPHAFWFKITSNLEAKIREEADSTRPDLIIDENKTDTSFESNSISTAQGHESNFREWDTCIDSDKTYKDNFNALLVPPSNLEQNEKSRNSQNSPPLPRFGTSEFEKTRLLPLSLYEIETPECTYKTPNKRSLPSDKETKCKKARLFSGIESEIGHCSIPKEVIKVENEVTNLNIPSTSKVENRDDSSKSLESESKFETIFHAEEKSRENIEKPGYESHANNSEDDNEKRPICQYENSCYRQNPQHKLEFCHPGDSDYVPYEERPLCQYGGACYRRNERHKVEFRHLPSLSAHQNSSPSSCSPCSIASSPHPTKRKRKKIKAQNLDFEDDDEYDLEDPFINDASSDEYVPSDVDSDEMEEDLDESQGSD